MRRTAMEMSCYRQLLRRRQPAVMVGMGAWGWAIDWNRILGLDFGARKRRKKMIAKIFRAVTTPADGG